MTPERTMEILDSGNIMGGYADEPSLTERAEIVKVWNTLPGWTCFNDALIAIAMPVLRKEGAAGYLLHRARIVFRAMKGKHVTEEYQTP